MPAGPLLAAIAQSVHQTRDRHRVPKAGSGGEGDRTPDLVNAIHALSQLSYAPHTPIFSQHSQHVGRHLVSGYQSTKCSTASDAAHTD